MIWTQVGRYYLGTHIHQIKHQSSAVGHGATRKASDERNERKERTAQENEGKSISGESAQRSPPRDYSVIAVVDLD